MIRISVERFETTGLLRLPTRSVSISSYTAAKTKQIESTAKLALCQGLREQLSTGSLATTVNSTFVRVNTYNRM